MLIKDLNCERKRLRKMRRGREGKSGFPAENEVTHAMTSKSEPGVSTSGHPRQRPPLPLGESCGGRHSKGTRQRRASAGRGVCGGKGEKSAKGGKKGAICEIVENWRR